MIVCIAEKPSVAKDIAKILGANTPFEGYMEGNGYQVTWTFGHLCELKYPEDYTSLWQRWSLAALPMIPQRFGIRLKKDKGIEKQFAVINKLMQNADRIINCGDAGQEGELIQRWVMQMARAKCPVDRLWISSLTEESIREGFNTLKSQSAFQSLYEAGLCRAIGDWLLGMNATRLYTLKYGRQQYGQPPLSIGRVQTPTLALIVRRGQEIENFTPQPYWVLTLQYRGVTFTAMKGRYESEEDATKALEIIKDRDFTITSVTKKDGKEAPPKLFDLTSLQVECNKKFNMTADRTLQVIQSLYEKKATTYPRVDTTYLSDDIYPKCKGILNNLKAYTALLAPLRGRPLKKSKKVFDSAKVTDHHAIIPTGVTNVALAGEELQVYDLIVKRFIAAFYPDCKFATTTVTGDVEKIGFKVTGKQILEPGWRTIFAHESKQAQEEDEKAEDDEERTLPTFNIGESGPHKPNLAQKFTQPPQYYTEATLLRAMETAGKNVTDDSLREALKENGIGRPSTRAAIIETLFRRCYIRRERKRIVATQTGIDLITIIHEELLKSAELTGIWEKKLREIERGEYEAAQFIAELKEMVTQITRNVIADPSNRHVTATPSKEGKSTSESTKSKNKKSKQKQ